MKTKVHLGSYIAHFFLKSELFQVKFIERFKTHVFFNNFFYSKIFPFMR